MDVDVMEADAFLADSVVVAENKLYAQGGGWDTIYTAGFPFKQPRIGIAIFLRIPWTATNHMHTFAIKILDQDGKPFALGDSPPGLELPEGKIRELTGQFNVGRPPLLNAGESQIVPIAVNLDGLEFMGPNNYSVILTVDGDDMRRLPMRVRTLAQVPSPARPSPAGA